MSEFEIVEIEGRKYRLAQIEKPSGTFKIAFARAKPCGFEFYYQDPLHSLFFSTSNEGGPSTRCDVWDVTSARVRSNTASIKLPASDEVRIRENIKFFFETRSYALPWRLADTPLTACSVSFRWKLS